MSEEFDFSKAIAEVQQMLSSEEGENQIQNLLGMLTGSSKEDAEGASSVNANLTAGDKGQADLLSGLGDIEMLMKLQSVMNIVGNQKNDSNAAFLQSLKPFLKAERRDKLDRAAKILTVTKAIKAFKELGLGGV